ncbi:VWA domain-containing protein [Oscillatoria sp. CS-180]|uniref:VWA domain-containing protein n=1 Tax=Oscillatoria sp. CS-180 TaxID=3021720 RepID=UPI00232F10A8|nr:VWA domain-containing protein [Oscillatoria sp. CS-180]MDB9529555.1 VWA domain-containing protein [Oscillatoria sp. CS-180]
MTLQIQPIPSNWTSQVASLCYVLSQWDRDTWKDYLQAFPDFAAAIDIGEQRIKGWELFAEEMFHRLYTAPQPIPHDQLRPEALWGHVLHQLINESVDIGELQIACRNNKLAAGEATCKLCEWAIEKLPQPPRSFNPQKAEELEAEFVRLQTELTAREEAHKRLKLERQAETDSQRLAALQQQLEQLDFDVAGLKKAVQKIKTKMGRVDKAAQAFAEKIGEAMAEEIANAVYQALNRVYEQRMALIGFGWGDGLGTLKCPGTAQQKERVAQRLMSNQRFRQIAEAAGRFQAIAALRQGVKRSKQVPDQIADTSTGNDLAKLAPSELVRVALDAARTHFMKDFAEESLMQQEFDGSSDDGQQGPVVICLDKSGSMDGPNEVESTGLMLALVGIAQSQNRKARVILYDSQVRHVKDIDPLTASPADRLDLADRQYGGGTDFMKPLSEALDALDKHADLKEADVVFITDGEADVTESFSQKWREAQQRLNFKVYTLLVGSYVNTEVLDRFSDINIHVRDLSDPQVHQVFDI